MDFLTDNEIEFDLPALKATSDPVLVAARGGPACPRVREGRGRSSSIGWRTSPIKAGDHRGHQFLQWFIEEQVEEEREGPVHRRPHRERHQPVPGRGAARPVRVGRSAHDPRATADVPVGQRGDPARGDDRGAGGRWRVRSSSPTTTRPGRPPSNARRHASGARSATRSGSSSTSGRRPSPGSRPSRSSTSCWPCRTRRTRTPTCRRWRPRATCSASASREWFEHRLFKGADPDVEHPRLHRRDHGDRPDAGVP